MQCQQFSFDSRFTPGFPRSSPPHHHHLPQLLDLSRDCGTKIGEDLDSIYERLQRLGCQHRWACDQKGTLAMQDPMRHAESRPAIESILRSIPGFKGYLEKEYRRDSDHLARTWLAEQLQKCKTTLDNWQRSLLDEGQIDFLPLCERLRSRVDTLQSQIKGAMRGYSGFFDFVKVDESVLEQVYQLDLGLVDDGRMLLQSFEELSKSEGSPKAKLEGVGQQLDELSRHFEQRNQLLKGLR
jgi:hypothetical protein